jgi:hypothetical protein
LFFVFVFFSVRFLLLSVTIHRLFYYAVQEECSAANETNEKEKKKKGSVFFGDNRIRFAGVRDVVMANGAGREAPIRFEP